MKNQKKNETPLREKSLSEDELYDKIKNYIRKVRPYSQKYLLIAWMHLWRYEPDGRPICLLKQTKRSKKMMMDYPALKKMFADFGLRKFSDRSYRDLMYGMAALNYIEDWHDKQFEEGARRLLKLQSELVELKKKKRGE